MQQARNTARLTGRQIAHQLGWSPSKASRLLNGKRGGTQLDVASFLAVCRVKGAERNRLLNLCADLNVPGWWQRYGDWLPQQLRTLIAHDDKAAAIASFEPNAVPGLLQTAEYARALVVGNGNVPEGELDDRVAARMERKSLFERSRPAEFTFFAHEFALRLPAGGPGVMSGQLHELLRMSVRSYLTLRVVPAGIGAHAGIAGGFTMLEFAAFRPVIYLDSETSCQFLENRRKPRHTGAS